jgi:hypothetical protein
MPLFLLTHSTNKSGDTFVNGIGSALVEAVNEADAYIEAQALSSKFHKNYWLNADVLQITSEESDFTGALIGRASSVGTLSQAIGGLGVLESIIDLNGPVFGFDYSDNFTEGGPAVLAVAASATITGPMGLTLSEITVEITNLQDAGEEILDADVGATGITKDYVAPTLTLTGPATLAEFQEVLRTVTYENTSDAPTVGIRSIQFAGSVTAAVSNMPVASITVIPVNDAPVIDLNGAGGGADFAADFTEGGPAVSIVDATATLTDADSTTLTSLTVTLTGLVDTGEEVLDANVGATGITKSYVAPTLTLTGPASVADFQQVLRAVTYENTMTTPTEGDRTIKFSATDGTNASNMPQTVVTVIALPTGPGEVVVNAVNFDGTNDYLIRGGALTGAASGKEMSCSFWLKSGVDGGAQHTYQGADDPGAGGNINPITRQVNNKLNTTWVTSGGTAVWLATTDEAILVADGWVNVLVSVNSATGARSIYLNDMPATLGSDTFVADALIDWDTVTNWAIGAQASGFASKFNGDMAEFWLDDNFIDFTVEANRRKFISIGGKPVELGANGQDPLGAAPLVYFSGPTVDWHTNKGSGGGFTENGALTDATTSPSD